MNFNKHDVTMVHVEVEAICKRARKLILVRDIAASHRLDEMNHL